MPPDSAKDPSQVGWYGVRRYSRRRWEPSNDRVAIEEPLEIRIGYSFKEARRVESAAITMRTPGNDRELAAGFLLSEGVIADASDIRAIQRLGSNDGNEIFVELAETVDVEEWRLRRPTLVNSACGVCGKRSIDAIPTASCTAADDVIIGPDLVYQLPELMRARQAGFAMSGGLHASALISATGEVLSLFEDIGRHNALDKVIGDCLLRQLIPLNGSLLFMSSRGSFELVQKTLAAGCSVLATVGAPSSLAVEFARDRSVTLIGFVREDRFNVYSGEWRVASASMEL